jgi:alpha-L-arabinofuranosidase
LKRVERIPLQVAILLVFRLAFSQTASITVHPSLHTGAVSDSLFGVGVEWTENGNRIFDSTSRSNRTNVILALKPLRLSVVRFPGGILADYYHWQDGIGPLDKRPIRQHPIDGTKQENSFGTDEYIDFCRSIGAQGVITANYGTGAPSETVAWQHYFMEEKFPIRVWEIGNEIYLTEPRKNASVPGNDQRIFHRADQYARDFPQWFTQLKKADPSAWVGAIAGTWNTSGENRGWLQQISRTQTHPDFVALHDAFAPLIIRDYDYSNAGMRSAAYHAMFAGALSTADDIRNVKGTLPGTRIAITEYFPLFGAGGSQSQLLAILDQSRTLAAGLYTASLFHVFMREGVELATYNLAVSKWFGALVLDTDQGIVRSPHYFVFDLYRNFFGTKLVGVEMKSSPTFAAPQVGVPQARAAVPALDSIASIDNSGRVVLAVINRDEMSAISSTITVDDLSPGAQAEVRTLNGPAANAVNGKSLSPSTQGGSPINVHVETNAWYYKPGATYSFPAHSVTMFRWTESPAGHVGKKPNRHQ